MLRILIADDHTVIRRGLRGIISRQPGWEVCGEAADGHEALSVWLREAPDVAILDVALPLLNGFGVARRMRRAGSKTEILLFTMHDDEETFRSGLAAGARSLLHKTDSEQHMVAAISALSAHQTYFSPAVSQLLLSSALHKRSRSSLEHFTGRELEVAQLIAEGHSSKQVARRLDISPKTVECHRSAVMRKSGTQTVGELVRFAIRRNLIQA